MAAKKIKTDQEAKAPKTHAAKFQAGQAGDNSESGGGTDQEPGAEDGEDTDPNPCVEDGESAGQDTETWEDDAEKPLPKVLTALRPVLYLARQFKAGDSLPVNNTEMVEAWIAAGSAEWKEKESRSFFP